MGDNEEKKAFYDEMCAGGKLDADKFSGFLYDKFMDEEGGRMVRDILRGAPGDDEAKAAVVTDGMAKIKGHVRPVTDEIFKFFDQDGNGEVTFEEFDAVTTILENGGEEAAFQALFNALDKNGNGKFEVDEAA